MHMFKHNETRYLLSVVGFAILALAVIMNPALLEFTSESRNIGGYAAAVSEPQSTTTILTIDRERIYRLGDIDRNGQIDASDLDVLRLKNREQQNPELSDLNQDGNIDFMDEQLMVDYLAGKFSSFPLMKGDIDFDGEITYRDAEIIASYVEGKREFSIDEFYAADLVRDGTVDDLDKGYLLDLISS